MEGAPEKKKVIQMYVYCRRDGVSRDGGLHATFPSQEEAEKKVPGELRWLHRFYDEVSYQLVEEEV